MPSYDHDYVCHLAGELTDLIALVPANNRDRWLKEVHDILVGGLAAACDAHVAATVCWKHQRMLGDCSQ